MTKRVWVRALAVLLLVAGPIAFVYGLGMMLSAAFGDGRNGIATIVTLSGLVAPLVGIVLLVMARRDR